MDAILQNLEKMYNSGNTWAEALALVGAFMTLYIIKKIKDFKAEQNASATQAQRTTDQATNRTTNQTLEDQTKAGADQVDAALNALDSEITTPTDPKDPKGNQ